ncbi:MAG TPA: glycosyltransferase family 2 protein [Chitinophagaceae bacterium]
MKNVPRISLCVSTYNWPEALELCLESVLTQTRMPDEVIIGDDGSGPDTAALVKQFQQRFPVPLLHVWQPDEGFQLARIRNRSFAAASGEYIIQADGDLVFHRDLVKDHLRFARKGCFLSGARSLLNPADSRELFQTKNISQAGKYRLEKQYNALRNLPAALLNYYWQQGLSQAKYVLGANMSFWKTDLVKVNGYDENYSGWGKEDNDLAIRLCNAGVKLHFLRFAAIIYHLYHKEAPRDKMAENEKLLTRAMREKRTFVANGLNQYLK